MNKLYKIVSVSDKNGNVDHERIAAIKDICESMTGGILHPEMVRPGNCLCVLWNNESGRMIRTSTIESVESNVKWIKVTTRNTIYELEMIE